jgi:hypothetical protein
LLFGFFALLFGFFAKQKKSKAKKPKSKAKKTKNAEIMETFYKNFPFFTSGQAKKK